MFPCVEGQVEEDSRVSTKGMCLQIYNKKKNQKNNTLVFILFIFFLHNMKQLKGRSNEEKVILLIKTLITRINSFMSVIKPFVYSF